MTPDTWASVIPSQEPKSSLVIPITGDPEVDAISALEQMQPDIPSGRMKRTSADSRTELEKKTPVPDPTSNRGAPQTQKESSHHEQPRLDFTTEGSNNTSWQADIPHDVRPQ
eukprot:CAMPEP_0196658612 /NCGR_PEP_ID=MMETSP1086-20130531/30565_1 /TAXON_ID=77921 /ORGANISM="Cyanoptyche  gloeocystis , Strain SAG4.97" /LENGTH=111 /DNA_ID=CAMNT_0041992255 /DNA_START=157 /DNA_END=492 /DNA_ORIENTATION=+